MEKEKRENKELESIYLSRENKELLKNVSKETGVSKSAIAGMLISKLKSRYLRSTPEGDIV